MCGSTWQWSTGSERSRAVGVCRRWGVARTPYRWNWRRYHTPSGGDPVGEYLRDLPAEDRRALTDAMRLIRESGVRGSRHLRGDLYEGRAQTAGAHYRLIFRKESPLGPAAPGRLRQEHREDAPAGPGAARP
jgi:hypothetical protein